MIVRVVGVILLLTFSRTNALADTVRQIAQEFLATGGCSHSHQNYDISIDGYKKLDKTYGGVLPGIEVTEYTRVGSASYGSFSLSPDGKLKFALDAQGGGTDVKKFGIKVCLNPTGSSIGVTVIGHFKD